MKSFNLFGVYWLLVIFDSLQELQQVVMILEGKVSERQMEASMKARKSVFSSILLIWINYKGIFARTNLYNAM